MTTLEYLTEKLFLLAENFGITVKYHYDDKIFRHIVELTPYEEYYNNEKLDNYWIEISLEFMKLFPDDNISFVSNDSTLISENHLLTFTAKELQNSGIDTFYSNFLNQNININYVQQFEFELFSQNLFKNIIARFEFKNKNCQEFQNIEINHDERINFNHEDYVSNDSTMQLPQAA
jgi:hypothetical protein